MKLRDYQQNAIHSVIEKIGRPGRKINPLIIAPTGAGKSLIIAGLVAQLPNLQILIITPRIKLLQQNAALIDGAGILSGKLGNDTGQHHRVICGTYQTLIKRHFERPQLIIVDEAHLVPEHDSQFSRLLDQYPGVQIVGLTATPFRKKQMIYEGDNRRWTKIFDIDMPTLIGAGYLVPPVSFKTLSALINDTDSDEDLITEILPELMFQLKKINRSKVLVFCKNVNNVNLCHDELKKIMSDWTILKIHSHMTVNDQNESYELFEQCQNGILINCSMLTTGVDLPSVDAIVILRRISSIALYVQIVGRGLRVSQNKTECAIFDYGYNSRYGYIDNIVLDKDFLKLGTSGIRTKTCDQCGAINNVNSKKCSYCSYFFHLKHVLSDFANGDRLLSNNLRLSVIMTVESVQQGNLFKHFFSLENEDTVIDFGRFSIQNKNYIGKRVVYEKIGPINKVLSIL